MTKKKSLQIYTLANEVSYGDKDEKWIIIGKVFDKLCIFQSATKDKAWVRMRDLAQYNP